MDKMISKIEKKSLFKTSLIIGTAFIILLCIQSLLASIISTIITLFNSSFSTKSLLYFATENVYTGYLIQSIVNSTSFIFCGWFIIKALRLDFYKTINFNKNQCKGTSIILIMFVMGAAMLSNIFVSRLNLLFELIFGVKATSPTIGSGVPNNAFEFIFMFVSVAIIPPLIEEFFFRGAVLGSLRKFGDAPAIIFSSLMFGLVHSNFIQIPFAFFVGLALAYITVISNSIWPAIIAHICNNAFSLFTQIIPGTIVGFLMYAILIIFIISLIWMRKNNASKNVKKVSSSLSSFNRFFRMVFSPTTILAITIFLATAVLGLENV